MELKHGRVAMLAVLGWFHVAAGYHIVGDYAVGEHLDNNPLVNSLRCPWVVSGRWFSPSCAWSGLPPMFLAPKFGVVEHHYVIGLELGLPCVVYVAYDFLNDFYTPKLDPFGPPKMAMINRTIKSSSNSIQAHFLGSQVSQVPINIY